MYDDNRDDYMNNDNNESNVSGEHIDYVTPNEASDAVKTEPAFEAKAETTDYVQQTSNRPTGGMYSGNRYDSSNNEGQRTFTTGSQNNTGSAYSSSSDSTRSTYSSSSSSTGSAYSQSTRAYDTGRTDSDSHMRLNKAIPDEPVKKNKKPGFAGKVAAALGLGVLFGLAAGATLFIMNQVHDSAIFKKADAAIEESIDNIKGIGKDDATEEAEASTEATPAIGEAAEDSAATLIQTAQITAYDVSNIAEEVMPSVVSIVGNYTVTSQNFFGQTFSQETEGSGSGIIIAKDDKTLVIATNNHVVEDSNSLKVQFIDGTEADARIKGTDANCDLAVILVDLDEISEDTMNEIKVAKLGDSEALKVGEPAIVIGNALGYGQSVTAGVISAVNRTVEDSSSYGEAKIEGLIQTDAAINPGNSGGALVNSKGEVVGISSSKISGSAVDSMGFAIPISKAEPILDDIVTSTERVKVSDSKAGYLGIGGVTVTSDVSQMYAIPVGVVVRQVYEGTGAADAGMIPGDVIKSINGKDISSMDELREELSYYEAGTFVEVGLYRYNEGEYTEKTLQVCLVNQNSLKTTN